MKWPLLFLLALLFWKFTTIGDLNSVWMSRWWLLLIGASVAFGLRANGISAWLVPTLTYTLFSVVGTAYSYTLYPDQPVNIQAAIREASAMSGLAIILVAGLMGGLRPRAARALGRGFACVGFLTAIGILLGFCVGYPSPGTVPFFDNASMGASFVAVTSFLMAPWTLFFTVPAILLTKASTPLAALLVGLGVLTVRKRAVKALALALFLIPVALYLSPLSEWMGSTGRAPIWRMMFHWWAGQPLSHLVYGMGQGTMRIWTPVLQQQLGVPTHSGPWFIWLHNDWLQILLEQGAAGLGFFLLACFGMVWEAWKNPKILAALFAFGVTMATNFPLHMPLHAFLGAWLVLAAFNSGGFYGVSTRR